jgi:large subunit ribosomal protein L22
MFRASHNYARVSGRKARYVIDLVRGRPVNDALNILRFTHKRASPMIEKVLRSAMANAGDREPELDVNHLFISEARVDEGPLSQGRLRYRIASRAGYVPIHKRTCHIKIELSARAGTGTKAGAAPRRKVAGAPKAGPSSKGETPKKVSASKPAVKKSPKKSPAKKATS